MAKAVAEAVIKHFGYTGLPLEIISDIGIQFIRKLVVDEIDRVNKLTPYHLQANGSLKDCMLPLEGTLKEGIIMPRKRLASSISFKALVRHRI